MPAKIKEIPITLPHPAFDQADWGDAFAVRSERRFEDAEQVAQVIMGSLPRWASGLMALRDRIVAPLGLKTGGSMADNRQVETIGPFPVLEKSPQTIVLGADDTHLNFRVVIELTHFETDLQVQLATLVKRNNALGVGYLAAIMPFHKLIVATMLRSLR